jgi:hypothetical protein
MAEATKPKSSTTPSAVAADQTPVSPAGLQPGERASAPTTTRAPRGVDEAPSNQIADEPAAKALQEHVQKVIDTEQAQGYRGDPNKNRHAPNEAYTLRGVGRGDPTPETTVHTPSSK